MIFTNTEKEDELLFALNDRIIPIKQDPKYIGITLTQDAKWTSHINDIIKFKHVTKIKM